MVLMSSLQSLIASMALVMCGPVTAQRPPCWTSSTLALLGPESPWRLPQLQMVFHPTSACGLCYRGPFCKQWQSPGRQASSQIRVPQSLWKILDYVYKNLEETRCGKKRASTGDFMGRFYDLFSDLFCTLVVIKKIVKLNE